MIEVLEKVWRQNPDLRLGQLLSNCAMSSGDVFYFEDDALLHSLEDYIKKPRRVKRAFLTQERKP